jgi:hypothetical protein
MTKGSIPFTRSNLFNDLIDSRLPSFITGKTLGRRKTALRPDLPPSARAASQTCPQPHRRDFARHRSCVKEGSLTMLASKRQEALQEIREGIGLAGSGAQQTSAAECLQQTESLFAENREPFFNAVDPERKSRLGRHTECP